MSKDIPQRAFMNLALAIAEADGLPLNQRHLNESEKYLKAAICDEEDCYLPAGHDSDCLPELMKAAGERDTLHDTLDSIVGFLPTDNILREVAEELLLTTKH